MLFAEAVRTRALIFHEALDARLLVVASSPTQGSLLAWAGDFFTALPTEGHIELEDSRLAPDFLTALRAKGHLELVVCAWSLQQELEGQLAGAVFVLGQALVQQQHLQPSEVTGIAAELGAEPTAEALRTVLHGWIQRGAAWGGPILGWMRDLHHRLALPSTAPPPSAAAGEGDQPR